MEYDSGNQCILSVEELEKTHAHKPFAIEDSYLHTKVVSSNHSECVRTMRERLIGEGFQMVDRSIVRFGKQIGNGGQGTVYEASVHLPYVEKAMTMAVKKFDPKLGIPQGQYPQELWIVEHSNILRPWAFFFDDDSALCMIMPLYFSDLRNAIDARMRDSSRECGASSAPFEDFIAFSNIMQIAWGMKGLHEVGIYHRDLKAANILVFKDSVNEVDYKSVYVCHIADFEASEHVVGTAFWRAPELLLSLRTRIPLTKDQWQAADVYSFGMTCYEILTGEIPFHGHPLSDYDVVLDGGRPELPDHIPQILQNIIWSCWHPDPDSRPNFGEIVEALMSHAREDPLLSQLPEALEINQTLMEWTTGSPQSDLMRLKILVQKHYDGNYEAKAGHQNYAFWGPRCVAAVERFVSEFGWNSYQTLPSLPFAVYLRRRTLAALISRELLAFATNVRAILATQQLLKDLNQYGALLYLEKSEMMVLAWNIYVAIMKGSDQSRFHDNVNDFPLKVKLKLLDAFVIEINGILEEGTALELIQDIVERVDPDGTDTGIAEFHLRAKFMIRRQTFVNKHHIHVRLVIKGIVLYLMFNSSNCKHILFRIFGIRLSDFYEVFLGFFFPLIQSHGIARLQFSIPRYRNHFLLLCLIVGILNFYFLFRSYGLLRYICWVFFSVCVSTCSYAIFILLLAAHEYVYLMLRRSRASFAFANRVKVKVE